MSERADPRAQFNNLPWKDKIGNFFMRKCGLFSLADWMVFQTPDAQSYYSEKIQKSMVSAFIENVFVYDGGRIVVRFKYEQSIQDAVKAVHTG